MLAEITSGAAEPKPSAEAKPAKPASPVVVAAPAKPAEKTVFKSLGALANLRLPK